MHPFYRIACAASLAAAVASPARASCGAAFCNVNTNWSLQGIWTEPGLHVDLRLEYIDQDQPMSGSRKVAVGEIPMHHDEVRTINRNAITTIDYGLSPNWGIFVTLPVVDRSHEHIHNHRGEKLTETWNFTELGDVRLMGRYQTYFGAASAERAGFAGATFGLVLPSGATDLRNGDGAVAERSLQPGTGTFQAAVTGYYRQYLAAWQSSWYAQAGAQIALDSYRGYRPGNQFALDLGYRYDVNDRLGLNLQLNYLYKVRDSGSEAEPNDSGGQALSLAPGLTWSATPAVQLYAFVAVPVYRYVNGVQLTADWSAAAGMSVQF